MTPEEEIAGYTVALVALLVVALGITATNAFALLFALPALHAWLWLPQIRIARPPVRARPVPARPRRPGASWSSRSAGATGSGFDTPWYLLELVGVGYIKPIGVVIVLAGTAAAAQLAAVPPAGTRRTRRRQERAAARARPRAGATERPAPSRAAA